MSDRVPPAPATGPIPLHIETEVSRRYADGALQCETELCCPVPYDPRYLEVIPREVIERDYGCGDPSRDLAAGETVLDLGCGGGKVCYIAAQIVGPEGSVIGVDMNDDMLDLARKHREAIGDRLGYQNVEFHKGKIQDLALDLEQLDAYLQANPAQSADDWLRVQAHIQEQRRERPMIADDSVDVIVSNCVLNLVAPADRPQMFAEMHRVLRRGGRVTISDIVCDESVPERLKNDPALWSGCISGAYVEHELLAAFAAAGFYGMEIIDRQSQPWGTVEGIEFRSITVRAYKGKAGPCMDHHQAVIYRGPWSQVTDDDGHTLHRGRPMAVCEKTYAIYTRAPYSDEIIPVPPRQSVSPSAAQQFDCRQDTIRDPKVTKGESFQLTQLPTDGCCGGECT